MFFQNFRLNTFGVSLSSGSSSVITVPKYTVDYKTITGEYNTRVSCIYTSTVYYSEAAEDREPDKPDFDDCAPNTQPNGLKFGGILYINGSCLNKPQMGQDGLLES